MDIYNPVSLDEALNLMNSGKGLVLAGGTDLLLHIKHLKSKKAVNSELPEFLLSLRNIPQLKNIYMDESTSELRIGSAVTFTELIGNRFIKENFPALLDASLSVGSVQIRNIATMGGNICNSSPAADSVPVLYALDAKCVLASTAGERILPIDEVILDKGKNCLNANEILTEIIIPISSHTNINSFGKIGKRNALAISRASAAIHVELQSLENPVIEKASICTGSLGLKSNHEIEGENYLVGKKLNEIDALVVAEIVSSEVENRLKGRSTMPYKKEVIKGLIFECIHKALLSYNQNKTTAAAVREVSNEN